MQFGFVKGKGTTDAIFTVRQMQENFRRLHIGINPPQPGGTRAPSRSPPVSW